MDSFVILPAVENESLSDYAYRVLLYNILHLNLKPNAPINEEEIATALGMSRTPVHEAIAHLYEIKLVDIYRRKMTKVSRINLMQLNEGLLARTAIEDRVVPMLIGRVSPEIREEMRDMLEKQRQCLARSSSLGEFYVYDRDFHNLFYKALGRESIGRIIRNLDLESMRIYNLVDYDGSSFNALQGDSYAEHVMLFEVVTGKRPLDFDIHAFLYNHIVRFRSNLQPYVDKYRDYFSFTGTDAG